MAGYSSLPNKRDKPRRTEHPIRPPGEHTPEPELDDEPDRSDPEYRALVDLLNIHAMGRCQAGLEGCTLKGEDPHHVFPVAWGGRVIVPLVWLRLVCRPCHGRIHSAAGREKAEELGLLVPRRVKS